MRDRLTVPLFFVVLTLACSPASPPAGSPGSPAPGAAAPAANASNAPAEVHARSIVIDTHADTTQRLLFEKGFDLGQRHENGNIDIPRMRVTVATRLMATM